MTAYYTIKIGNTLRQLPIIQVQPGISIAVLNILGDTELIESAAALLSIKLSTTAFDLFLTAETKSIPLAHSLSVRMQKNYVVLRKNYKTYMGKALHAETHSITTGSLQTLYLDEKDAHRMAGKNIVIIDDVFSTGSTLVGMQKIAEQVQAKIMAEAALAIEGDLSRWQQAISLVHLPIFP
jgi:adenine/guanine phosphoribosyltransferase-like PRPP-binding protein